MQIVAQISGEHPFLVGTLASLGIDAKMTSQGTVIVQLRALQKRGPDGRRQFEIPPEVGRERFTLFLEVTEHTNRTSMVPTSSTVVCGSSGSRIKPLRIPLNLREQACFSMPIQNAPVMVTSYPLSSRVAIIAYWIVLEGTVASIRYRILWKDEAPPIKWMCSICGTIITNECPEKHNSPDGLECWGSPSCIEVALPEEVKRFQAAVIAAQEKSRCPRCRCVHFAAP